MKKVMMVVSLLVIGAAVVSLNIHIVRLDNSIRILRKVDMTFTDTYVDARGMKKLALLRKPALIKAGLRNLIDDDGLTIKK